MEPLGYNLLFRWFVGPSMDAPVWDVTVFTKNRDCLIAGNVAGVFLGAVAHAQVKGLLSNEHFSVDGMLIEGASIKSFDSGEPPGPGRNGELNFHGERRRNDTRVSTTDPEAKLFYMELGKEAKRSFMGHVLMENRNGLVVGAAQTQASGFAERHAALDLIGALTGWHPIKVGADKGYDSADFGADLRAPHVAQNTAGRCSRIDTGSTQYPGYALSQRCRKCIDEVFGWVKTVAGHTRSRFRGTARVGWAFTFATGCCNLIRLPKLLGGVP